MLCLLPAAKPSQPAVRVAAAASDEAGVARADVTENESRGAAATLLAFSTKPQQPCKRAQWEPHAKQGGNAIQAEVHQDSQWKMGGGRALPQPHPCQHQTSSKLVPSSTKLEPASAKRHHTYTYTRKRVPTCRSRKPATFPTQIYK